MNNIINFDDNVIGIIVPNNSNEFAITQHSTNLARIYPTYKKYLIPRKSYQIIGEYSLVKEILTKYNGITESTVSIVQKAIDKYKKANPIKIEDNEKIVILSVLPMKVTLEKSTCCNSFIYKLPSVSGLNINNYVMEPFCFYCLSRTSLL